MFSKSMVTGRAVIAIAFCLLWCVLLFVQTRWAKPEKLAMQFTETEPGKPIAVKQCADCHSEHSEMFHFAPHRTAVRPSSAPKLKAIFDGGKYYAAESNTNYEFYYEKDVLWMKSDRYPQPVRLNWVFGSGRFAHTPVGTWVNPDGKTEGIECMISFYPGIGFGTTLGSTDSEPSTSDPLAIMGVHLSTEKSIQCFGCHTTYLPRPEEKIDEKKLTTGLNCERCHTGTHQHMREVEGKLEPEQYQIAKLKNLSARDSVLLCAECHRRPDNFLENELDPDNKLFIRFAPVGVLQSACFLKQESILNKQGEPARYDCVSCHDPHQLRKTEPAYYNQKCLNCHGDQKQQATMCSQEVASSNCIQCHMPKVQIHEHLKFTDHWIRIRDK